MAVKIITVPFNAQTGLFEDDVLQEFLLNKKNVELKSEFFQINGNAYWTVYVVYEEVFEKARQPVMSEPERMLYEKLQSWRKEQAHSFFVLKLPA
jgi:Cdc6-like AAA superfamily ATPase